MRVLLVFNLACQHRLAHRFNHVNVTGTLTRSGDVLNFCHITVWRVGLDYRIRGVPERLLNLNDSKIAYQSGRHPKGGSKRRITSARASIFKFKTGHGQRVDTIWVVVAGSGLVLDWAIGKPAVQGCGVDALVQTRTTTKLFIEQSVVIVKRPQETKVGLDQTQLTNATRLHSVD